MSFPLLSSDVATLVHKRELARAIGCSVPTVTDLIDRYPDFPIERRGTNGLAWQFDIAKVVPFLAGERDRQERERAKKDERLAQLVLPLNLTPPAAAPAAVSLKDQVEAAKLREMLRKEAIAAGDLVNAQAVEENFAKLLGDWSRRIREFVRQLAREQSWTDEVLHTVEARLSDMQDQLVDSSPELLHVPSVNAELRFV